MKITKIDFNYFNNLNIPELWKLTPIYLKHTTVHGNHLMLTPVYLNSDKCRVYTHIENLDLGIITTYITTTYQNLVDCEYIKDMEYVTTKHKLHIPFIVFKIECEVSYAFKLAVNSGLILCSTNLKFEKTLPTYTEIYCGGYLDMWTKFLGVDCAEDEIIDYFKMLYLYEI